MLHEVRAPEACQKCDGCEWVDQRHDILGYDLGVFVPCPDCSTCPECGFYSYRSEPCGPCFDEAEAHFARATDRG